MNENISLNKISIIEDLSKQPSCSRLEMFFYDTVKSTNDTAKKYALSHPEKEAIFVANGQSAGRGSRNRSFFSPYGTGLYMSFLLSPNEAVKSPAILTCMAAVAVCEAIETALCLNPKIKWVNDIYFNERKVCGVLTEGQSDPENGALLYAIVGIGINLYAPKDGFPDEIKEKAGALLTESRDANVKNKLCSAVIKSFFEMYRGTDKKDFLDGYRSRSLLNDKYVRVNNTGSLDYDGKTALVKGIDDDCRLILRFEDGKSAALSSGEVSLL